MNFHHRPARLAFLAVLALITVVSLLTLRAATDGDDERSPISVSTLKGPWALSLVGFTGCGQGSIYATFNLDGSGSSMATVQFHGQCGDAKTPNLPFVIQSVNPDGSGRANLSCGPGCGWNLIIQVAKDRQIFSAVDVDPVNPGNFLAGTAIRQLSSGDQ